MVDDKDLARGAFVNYLNKLSNYKHNKEVNSNKKKNSELNKNF